MKYLLLIVNAEADWQRLSAEEQQRVIDGMNRIDAELRDCGKFVLCGGLAPSASAKTVRLTKQERVVVDGPAWKRPEDDHLVTGFFVIESKSIDEAVSWARKLPIIAGAVEVREIAME